MDYDDVTAADRAAVCDAAADLLLTHGWHQGDRWPGGKDEVPWRPGLPLCLMAALRVAADTTLPELRPGLLMLDLRPVVGRAVGATLFPASWNDADGRTVDDVIDVLRRLGKTYREQVIDP
jgi:hypothetical protein